MREIEVSKITEAVRDLFIDCNHRLSPDVLTALTGALEREESAAGRVVISELIENAGIAADQGLPVCQDTGLAIVFIEVGQDVSLVNGSLKEAVNEGVRQGAVQGYLRSSTCNCFSRRNTANRYKRYKNNHALK
ncbi:L(+)-tartrate dehydratase subunit alpha [subsurface metagenome]